MTKLTQQLVVYHTASRLLLGLIVTEDETTGYVAWMVETTFLIQKINCVLKLKGTTHLGQPCVSGNNITVVCESLEWIKQIYGKSL
jgi:hypothetical protein